MQYTHIATYLFTNLCHELDNEVNLRVKSLINQNSWHSIKADKEIKQTKKNIGQLRLSCVAITSTVKGG